MTEPAVVNFRGERIGYAGYLARSGWFAGRDGRAVFLRHALRGLTLTAEDQHMAAWLADWDDHTVRAICRWLEAVRRLPAREAGSAGVGRHHWRDRDEGRS